MRPKHGDGRTYQIVHDKTTKTTTKRSLICYVAFPCLAGRRPWQVRSGRSDKIASPDSIDSNLGVALIIPKEGLVGTQRIESEKFKSKYYFNKSFIISYFKYLRSS